MKYPFSTKEVSISPVECVLAPLQDICTKNSNEWCKWNHNDQICENNYKDDLFTSVYVK